MNAFVATTTTRTTCPYCGVGCGLVVTRDAAGSLAVAGDPDHPANYGRLCSKGAALGDTLGLETRLLTPQVDGRDASWDEAIDRVATGFRAAIDAHGPDSVALYLSGQLITEDYYVANKLLKGFVGTGNVDTNSRLCMASSVAGHKRAFGSDTVPGCYEDLDEADLLVLVGSNAAWCHPVLYQRMVRNRQERGARIVTVEVRGTATSESADQALVIAPGTDGALFSGLFVHLEGAGAFDRTYIADHTSGLDGALARARAIAPTIQATALACQAPVEDVAAFFAAFAKTRKVVTLYSQGVNQAAQGTDKVNAIVNCHLATGRIGQPGMGPFSLTGQPNAMGGREVGGLANQLAAHMGFTPAEVDRVGRFWGTGSVASREGLKAVDLFAAIERGTVKALWVMGTNPAVSLPDADRARRALAMLDLLVVSDNVTDTDTVLAGAHVLLPAAAWGEKDGTVTNSERRISRQRAFLPLPGEVRPDWWALARVAERLGFGAAFRFAGPGAIFREHAALSAFENHGSRDFDIGGLAGIDDRAYDALEPVQWPVPAQGGTARLFAAGGFFTGDRKARFVSIAEPTAAARTVDHPLVLNTGRIRDQWHTMTRTGLSVRLGEHRPEPFIEINPHDAETYGIVEGRLARVTTAQGKAVLRAVVTPAMPQGRLFAPIHWSDMNAAGGRVGALVHGRVDPISGQPDSKAVPAAIAPCGFTRHGFLVWRETMALGEHVIHAWRPIEGGFATPIATDETAEALLARLPIAGCGRPTRYADPARDIVRLAYFKAKRLVGVLVLQASDTVLPAGRKFETPFASETIASAARHRLLAERAASGGDTSPTVCACFGVRSQSIAGAIQSGARTAEAVGVALRAGTNCGSCVPEIRRMITAATVPSLAGSPA